MASKARGMDWRDALEAEVSVDNEEIEVRIRDRHGEPYTHPDGRPCVVYVYGEYSRQVRAHDEKARKRTLRTVRSGARLEDRDPRVDAAERLVAATARWDLSIGGQEIPFTAENARVLYIRAPWIVDQLGAAMRNPSDFFESGSGT